MASKSKEREVLKRKGLMSPEQCADECGVSLFTVDRVWKTTSDDVSISNASKVSIERGTIDIDYHCVIEGYGSLLNEIRNERTRFQTQADIHPDNCAWGNLIMKSIEAEIKTMKEVRESLGLGEVLFIGEDGYTYPKYGLEQWRDREKSPRMKQEEDEERRKHKKMYDEVFRSS